MWYFFFFKQILSFKTVLHSILMKKTHSSLFISSINTRISKEQKNPNPLLIGLDLFKFILFFVFCLKAFNFTFALESRLTVSSLCCWRPGFHSYPAAASSSSLLLLFFFLAISCFPQQITGNFSSGFHLLRSMCQMMNFGLAYTYCCVKTRYQICFRFTASFECELDQLMDARVGQRHSALPSALMDGKKRLKMLSNAPLQRRKCQKWPNGCKKHGAVPYRFHLHARKWGEMPFRFSCYFSFLPPPVRDPASDPSVCQMWKILIRDVYTHAIII